MEYIYFNTVRMCISIYMYILLYATKRSEELFEKSLRAKN